MGRRIITETAQRHRTAQIDAQLVINDRSHQGKAGRISADRRGTYIAASARITGKTRPGSSVCSKDAAAAFCFGHDKNPFMWDWYILCSIGMKCAGGTYYIEKNRS